MKKYIIIFSIILSVFTLSACNNEQKAESLNEDNSDHSITHENSDFKAFKFVTYLSKKSPLIEIRYPHFKNDDINNVILNSRDHDINEFNKMIQDDNENNLLVVDFIPKQFNKDIYLFNKSKKARISDSDIFSQDSQFAINIKTGQVGNSDTLFSADDNLNKLFNLLDTAIKADGSIYPYYQNHKLKAYLEHPDNIFDKINFEGEYAIFQFEAEEIGLPAMGTPRVRVKSQNLIPLFNENIQSVITGKKIEKDEKSSEDIESQKDNAHYAIRDLDPNQKMVALTFDDGPRAETTNLLLDKLQRNNVKATFFMLGSSIETYPDTATRVDHEGHEIGNHSYSHKDMMDLNLDAVLKEINDTTALIETYTNQTPKFFRPPYGSFDNNLSSQINLETAFWSVDTKDWLTHDGESILMEIKENVADGSIILMHDIHMDSVEIIEDIINYLRENGFRFVTVSEMSHYKGENTLKTR